MATGDDVVIYDNDSGEYVVDVMMTTRIMVTVMTTTVIMTRRRRQVYLTIIR